MKILEDKKKPSSVSPPKDLISRPSSSSDKEVKKNTLLSYLEIGGPDYSAIIFTPEEMNKLRCKLTNISTGSAAAIPLKCDPNRCPFRENCVLVEIGKPPSGLPCLIEINLLREWRRQYIVEYDIDPDSKTELDLVNELAEIELLLWRVNNNLSKPENAELVQEDIVGADREGNPLIKRSVSTFLELKERLSNKRNKIIKLMVGDRQEKYKREAALKVREEKDPSSNSADLSRQLKNILQAAQQVNTTIQQSSTPRATTILTAEDIIDDDDGGEE